VELALHGEDAVAKVQAADVRFDAVLMDVQMPVMDGLEATRRIRALPDDRVSRLPVVGLTAGVSLEERLRAQEAGMDTVVGKPFDPDLLVHTLVQLVGPPVANTPLVNAPPGNTSPVAALAPQIRGVPPAEASVPGSSDLPPMTSTPQRPPIPADWPRLADADPAIAYKRLSGDAGLLRNMAFSVRQLLIRNTRLCALDAPTVAQLAEHAAALHDLKSMAGSLGAADVMDQAGHAERLLRRQEFDEGRTVMRQLNAVGAALVQSIEQQWPQATADDTRSAAAMPAVAEESGDLSQLLAQLQSTS
jgi:CheY-like chemotaxis protein